MWIKTSEQLPPISKWVLVTTGDFQKTCEIKCYMGKRTREYHKCGSDETFEEIYDAWTSGHGDISGQNPDYWMELPDVPQ